jgi:hypothetical protein
MMGMAIAVVIVLLIVVLWTQTNVFGNNTAKSGLSPFDKKEGMTATIIGVATPQSTPKPARSRLSPFDKREGMTALAGVSGANKKPGVSSMRSGMTALAGVSGKNQRPGVSGMTALAGVSGKNQRPGVSGMTALAGVSGKNQRPGVSGMTALAGVADKNQRPSTMRSHYTPDYGMQNGVDYNTEDLIGMALTPEEVDSHQCYNEGLCKVGSVNIGAARDTEIEDIDTVPWVGLRRPQYYRVKVGDDARQTPSFENDYLQSHREIRW